MQRPTEREIEQAWNQYAEDERKSHEYVVEYRSANTQEVVQRETIINLDEPVLDAKKTCHDWSNSRKERMEFQMFRYGVMVAHGSYVPDSWERQTY